MYAFSWFCMETWQLVSKIALIWQKYNRFGIYKYNKYQIPKNKDKFYHNNIKYTADKRNTYKIS